MDEQNNKNVKQKLFISVVTAVVVLLLLLLGLSRAWYVNHANIATLVAVTPPSPISIRGAHGYTQTNLDLSYTQEEIDSKTKTVTIKRVISVATDAEEHRLEIAHTTNLKNFNFKIYAATEVESGGSVSATANNTTYKYSYDTNPLTGSYLNAQPTDGSLSDGYRKATSDYGDNFTNDSNLAQIHAQPVYWLASENLAGTEIENNNPDLYEQVGSKYLSYYVVEISWQEDTKETDMFYVLAENA